MTFAEARKLYNESHARTLEFVKNFDESRTTPGAEGFPPTPERRRGHRPPGHAPFWHFGQLTVNRKMLGKPKYFDIARIARERWGTRPP
jgi:hypothetical protein